MMGYWWYLLKVSTCILVFYSFYSLVLRNSTFFLLNRLYLLFGLVLSFVIPVLNFSIFKSQPTTALQGIATFWTEPEYDFFQPQNLSNNVTNINYSIVLPVIYFAGITILFFKLLFSIIRILHIRKHSETLQIGQKKIIRMDLNSPFSFFNSIFLPKNENSQMVIEHELAHIRQLHWCDLVLVEIVSVLLWFNPFVFLYKKSLKLQHEYLADASVIKDKNRIEGYLTCMLKQVQTVSFNGIISQFYCKTIKKRIVMITKNKTSYKYLVVYSLALPLVFCMLFVFSGNNVLAQNGENQTSALMEPSIYPVDSKKVKGISGYGERINPVTKKKVFHQGVDLAIPAGEEVLSTAEGVVVDANFDSKKGNYVMVKHNETFSTFYSHLKNTSVKAGDKLEKGQVIGYSGSTGTSTGPHLHYEVIKNGKNVNPEDYLPKK